MMEKTNTIRIQSKQMIAKTPKSLRDLGRLSLGFLDSCVKTLMFCKIDDFLKSVEQKYNVDLIPR